MYSPQIIVLAGTSLSGKTTLGTAISKGSNLCLLDVDVARKEINQEEGWLGPDKEREIMLEAYTYNHQKALKLVREGMPVVLTGTYGRSSYHELLIKLHADAAVPLHFFYLHCPDDNLYERLEKRKKEGSTSNVTTREALEEQRSRHQRFEGLSVMEVDTSQSLEKCVQQIKNQLS